MDRNSAEFIAEEVVKVGTTSIASSGGQGSPIVDGHVHVFAKLSQRYPRDVHPLYPPEREAPVELLLQMMGENVVEKAVLVPLSPHDEYVAESLRRFPGRFAGVAVFDPAVSDPLADYRRRVETSGFQGLRMFRLGDPSQSPESLPVFPLLAWMAEHRHKLWYYPSPDELPLMARTLDLLPGLDVMMNHLGFCQQGFARDEQGRPRIDTTIPPSTLPTVVSLSRFEGVCVMFSGEYAFSREAFPYRDLTAVVDSIYRAFGANRMMWASDFPFVLEAPGYAPQLSLVDHYLPGLTAEERAAIMGGTALRLFAFG
jgi:L-fuconolactonase